VIAISIVDNGADRALRFDRRCFFKESPGRFRCRRLPMTTKGFPMFGLPPAVARLCLLGVFGLALACGLPAKAQQFSADLVTAHDVPAATPAGKLHVSDSKVRIETPEFPDGFFLIDGTTPAAYFVRPGARIFMDARQSSRLTRLFVAVDPDDPCRQWQAMAQLAGTADQGDWRCERAGEETIAGREATAYQVVSAAGKQFVGWIDSERKFPLRIKTVDGTVVTVENVRDAPQSAQLFDIPAGFRKFDPAALIERIKQSDVWVVSPTQP
jgi:hypothetical protein